MLLAALAPAAACHNPAPGGESGSQGASQFHAGPGPVVTGTVLDARSGKPIAGAVVRGPGGIETKSDGGGRFVLRGLALGASGELVGTSEAGLSGKNLLRALESGPLEVVLYLR